MIITRKIGDRIYGLMQLPYGTVHVILNIGFDSQRVVILCNQKIFIKEKLSLYRWNVIGPVSQVCDIIINHIGTVALALFLLESGLTENNALLLQMNDVIVYNN